MPDTYRSQHAGSIADLMRQRGQIEANAVRQSGDAAAQARAASGQAWGGAIQNIGNTVSGTLADIAQQRADAPNRELRQRQSDLLHKQISALDTESAQTEIGRLAQMVKASGYDPGTAEPLFRAIGKLSPEYEAPLMRSLMEPELLKNVTEALITQTPGYKAPEGFSLSEGQSRFGPDGKPIASVPKSAPVAPPPQPFTLTPGAKRYNPDGSVVAEVPANQAQPSNPTEASLAMLAAKGDQEAKAALQVMRDQRPNPSSEPRPLTQTAEAAIINRLSGQWTAANKPMKELERQVQLMNAGMEAVKRGDMAQGAQAVLVTFQKILDPPSVVRESEYARSSAGQSLQNRVIGAYQRLKQGGAGVTPAELQKFATLAAEAAAAQRKASGIDAIKSRLGRTADRYNIPNELIFEDFESTGSGGGGNYLSSDPNAGEPIKTPLGKPKG